MDLSKYTGFFHDGSLLNLEHSGDHIEISMKSAEIIPEHMLETMPLLKNKRIVGNLYLFGVKNVKVNKKPFFNILTKEYDSGSILDFEVSNHTVYLGIEWTDYPPKPRKSEFSTIEIEAETIWWENIPDLETDC